MTNEKEKENTLIKYLSRKKYMKYNKKYYLNFKIKAYYHYLFFMINFYHYKVNK